MIVFHRFIMFLAISLVGLIVSSPLCSLAVENVVINEILYNPSEDYPFDYEFVELFNPNRVAIDLSGFAFTEGIAYRIPDGTVLAARSYLLVVRNPNLSVWQNRRGTILGPFIGELDDAGALLRFRSPDGTVADEVKYNDRSPWPRNADGYGSSLERVSPDEPSDSPYTWRSSLTAGGTPGSINSVADVPARPVVISWSNTPALPRSTDNVQIDVALEGGEESLSEVTLRYEIWDTIGKKSFEQIKMEAIDSDDELLHYRANILPQKSQSLVRLNWSIKLESGTLLVIPHDAEPRPFESYFVYDNEIPSRLPILWMFPDRSTALSPSQRSIRGIVVKPLDTDAVELYDGASIQNSLVDLTGRKIKFLKGEEYRGDRTINISPEWPTHPNSGGADTNHKDHLAFQVFRDQGVLSSRCDWYRVIENGIHGQRTATEQVNEKFLEINNLDPNADIYKIAYNEPNQIPGMSIHFSKQTHLETGSDELFAFLDVIKTGSVEQRKEAILRNMEVDEVIHYSVAGVLIGNWDGFFNNMFLIHTPFPIDKWACAPWDLDKTFGYTDGAPPTSTTFAEMPLEFPLDGQARLASRQPGPVSRPLHQIPEFHEAYLDGVRKALNGPFSLESMNQKIDAIEDLLLDDLQLEADYLGVYRTKRQKQIQSAYDTVRTFLRLRHEYLRPLLFTPVQDWSIY